MQKLNDLFVTNLVDKHLVNDSCLSVLTATEYALFQKHFNEATKSMIVHDNYEIEDMTKFVLVSKEENAFFVAPERTALHYRIKHPFAFKATKNPEESDYIVTGEMLGLIGSMVAFKRMNLDYILEINHKNENKNTLLGLFSRVFSAKNTTTEDSLHKIEVLQKAIRESINATFSELRDNPSINEEQLSAIEASNEEFLVCIGNID